MARAAAVPSLVAASALLLAALLLALDAPGANAAVAGEMPLSWELGVVGGAAGDEEAMASAADSAAVVRRVLQGQSYISYGALRRDTTPCSVRGASYYNCQPGAQANPYSRGCSAITQCRG